MRLQTCRQWCSAFLIPRHIHLTVFDTHIYDLSVSSGRLELKEHNVEDRHLVGRRTEDVVVTSIQNSRVATCVFLIVQSVCLSGSVSLNASDCSYVRG